MNKIHQPDLFSLVEAISTLLRGETNNHEQIRKVNALRAEAVNTNVHQYDALCGVLNINPNHSAAQMYAAREAA